MRNITKKIASILLAVLMVVSVLYAAIPEGGIGIRVEAKTVGSYNGSESYCKNSNKYYTQLLAVELGDSDIDNLLAIAKSQEGYKAGTSNNDLSGSSKNKPSGDGCTSDCYTEYGKHISDNRTSYNNMYAKNPNPWCAYFVSWCARRAGIGEDIIPSFPGCTDASKVDGTFEKANAKRHIRWDKNDDDYDPDYIPQKGDLIFLGNATTRYHVGIVDYSNGEKVWYYDGNYASASPHIVHYTPRSLSRDDIYGYITPDYSGSPDPTITVDNTPPKIKGTYSYMLTDSLLRVCCEVENARDVDHAIFKTWTTSDQSDIICRNGRSNGSGTFFVDIPVSEHKATPDVFITFACVYDKAGNESYLQDNYWVDQTPPEINGMFSYMISKDTVRVCVVPRNISDVDHVDIYTWTTSDQSDCVMRKANSNGIDTYFVDFPISEHSKNPDVYISHAYVYNSMGFYSVPTYAMWADKEPPKIKDTYSYMLNDNTVRVCTLPEDMDDIDHVDIYTWTTSDQSDLVKRTARSNLVDTYFVDIPISEHKSHPDVYISHVYAYDVFGNCTIKETTLWMDYERLIVADAYNHKLNNDTLRVCAVPSNNDLVGSVKIATWTTADQSDLVWRDARFNGSETYFVDIPVSEYRSDANRYISHIYMYDKYEKLAAKEVSYVIDQTPPVIADAYNYMLDENTLRICCVPEDMSDVDHVRIATWTTGDMSDLVWRDASSNGIDTFFISIPISEYRDNAKTYISHIYVYDKAGNAAAKEVAYRRKGTADSISLSESRIRMNVMDTTNLVAIVEPKSFSTELKWSSTDETVAYVNEYGMISAIGEGECKIVATVGDCSAECEITITSVSVDRILISETSANPDVGDVVHLSAYASPMNHTSEITWSSSDESVATVDECGYVTVIGCGTCKITASADGFSTECDMTVVSPATSLSLDKSELNIKVGETADIKATVTPADSTDSVFWYVDQPEGSDDIISIDNGKVTGLREGSTTIIAVAGDCYELCEVTVTIDYQDYDVTPNINGGASKLYEPWGLRYFAVYDGADADKIATRGIAILKDTYYDTAMTAEEFCADDNVHIFSGDDLGFEAASAKYPNGRYYATLTEGIYSYDISSYYYVVPFAVMQNGQTVYGTIKKNSMEKIINTNLTSSSISTEEKAICTCILDLKNSVAAHYAAVGVPGASIDMDVPRGSSQTAAKVVKTVSESGITPNIVAGASRLIEPWGLRYFATYTDSDSISDRGEVILCEKYYDTAYSSAPDGMRLNANAYVFRESDGSLLKENGGTRYYATVTEGISSKDIADTYYVVPFVVLKDGSYVYGTVKSNSMMKIMNINLKSTSVSDTEKAVSQDIIDLYNAVKAYYEAQQ